MRFAVFWNVTYYPGPSQRPYIAVPPNKCMLTESRDGVLVLHIDWKDPRECVLSCSRLEAQEELDSALREGGRTTSTSLDAQNPTNFTVEEKRSEFAGKCSQYGDK